MRKTRDLSKGTFHAKMGSIKDRNGMDLTEAEDSKRWQEYTEELCKEDLHDPDKEEVARIHRRTVQKNLHECDHSPRARHPGKRSRRP